MVMVTAQITGAIPRTSRVVDQRPPLLRKLSCDTMTSNLEACQPGLCIADLQEEPAQDQAHTR